jgi:hypothetical protein
MPEIFVFGSNLAGRHGKGAALYALQKCGAIRGQGKGLQGRSYAIPTKDKNLRVLSLGKIRTYVLEFIKFAINNPDVTFNVSRIGCGYASYRDEQIAPMFAGAPDNCILPDRWRQYPLKLRGVTEEFSRSMWEE